MNIVLRDNNFEYRQDGIVSFNQLDNTKSQIVKTNDGLITCDYIIYNFTLPDETVTEEYKQIYATNLNTLVGQLVYAFMDVECYVDDFTSITNDSICNVMISGNTYSISILPQRITSKSIMIPIIINTDTTNFTISIRGTFTGTVKFKNTKILMLQNA